MYQGLALCAVSLVLATGAVAQDDTNKRLQHLPYITAATDCWARVIKGNPPAIGLAAQGRWEEALQAVFGNCRAEMSQMISVHDQIYGPRTGVPFATGPYRQDLPRALSTRLRLEFEAYTADLDRRLSEAATRS